MVSVKPVSAPALPLPEESAAVAEPLPSSSFHQPTRLLAMLAAGRGIHRENRGGAGNAKAVHIMEHTTKTLALEASVWPLCRVLLFDPMVLVVEAVL